MPLDVYFLPDSASDKDLAGRTVVVIDVLRATTTITQALSAGALEVIPCLEVEEARRIAKSIPGAVLGGERGGRRIEGFQLGNSPAEYTPQAVSGKRVVFTTTNGTRAMQRCRGSSRVLLGAFSNLSALVTELRKDQDFALVCAGTDGHVTREDVLFAGAVIERSAAMGPGQRTWNDEALLASSVWRELQGSDEQFLVNALLESRGGRNLADLGMVEDIRMAAQIDTTTVVAELMMDSWRVQRRR